MNGLCDYETANREVSATFLVAVHWFRHTGMPLNLCSVNKEFGWDSTRNKSSETCEKETYLYGSKIKQFIQKSRSNGALTFILFTCVLNRPY
jgi:hypothetical protein